jgi:hypothetical protein
MVQEPFGQVLATLNDQDARDGAAALVCGHLGRATLGSFEDVHAILGVRPGASLQEVKAASKRYASSLERC